MFELFEKLKKLRPQTDAKEIRSGGEKIEYIIAGLGNPGAKYQDTRHNAGFMAVDFIAQKHGNKIDKIKFKSLCGEIKLGEVRCLILKPQTFMNNSGQAIVEAMNFYKVPIEKVVAVYDETLLEVGKIRVRRKGSDGGHNGVKSIIYLTGQDTFPRVKIGIGARPHPDYDLAKWVLSSFKPYEIPAIKEAAEKAAECVRMIVSGEINEAMNRFNS